ncbi:MAG: hypothetical protein ACRYF3_01680 [Janthinobacterium lividum]
MASLVAVVVLLAVVLVRSQRPESPATPALPVIPALPAPAAADYPFGDASEWRRDVRSAPVAAESATLVQSLARQVADHYGGVAAFNVNSYTASFYPVGPDVATVDVEWDNCQDKDYTPRGLLGAGGQFTAIPIPDTAQPSAGRDAQLTVYSPATDQLWELWRARRTGGHWQACWGGRIDHVSHSPGFFTHGFGASASGLAISGGMVWVDDAQAGRIDHALSLAVIDVRHWKTVSWPAQRSDGGDHAETAIPEGTRFRLDPSLDLDTLALSPMARMVARAAQTYGFIVTDRSGAVAVTAQSGAAAVTTQSGAAAVTTQSGAAAGDGPWPGLLGGAPSYQVMADFPWDQLQALPMNFARPAP